MIYFCRFLLLLGLFISLNSCVMDDHSAKAPVLMKNNVKTTGIATVSSDSDLFSLQTSDGSYIYITSAVHYSASAGSSTAALIDGTDLTDYDIKAGHFTFKFERTPFVWQKDDQLIIKCHGYKLNKKSDSSLMTITITSNIS